MAREFRGLYRQRFGGRILYDRLLLKNCLLLPSLPHPSKPKLFFLFFSRACTPIRIRIRFDSIRWLRGSDRQAGGGGKKSYQVGRQGGGRATRGAGGGGGRGEGRVRGGGGGGGGSGGGGGGGGGAMM